MLCACPQCVPIHWQDPCFTRRVWPETIPEEQWTIYQSVIRESYARDIRFALGGAFALAAHTGRWRDTKDLDVYVLPQDRDRMIELVTDLGLADYFDTKPYDRWWIYRSFRDATIVDVIWAMANHRAQIDDLWLSGPEIDVLEERVRVVPAEAIFWDKLYIMQRDRCDWTDIMNLLHATGPRLQWDYILCRIGDDGPLAAAALSIYKWLAPGHARALPEWIWARLGLAPPAADAHVDVDTHRVSLLDRRPWFGPDREKTLC